MAWHDWGNPPINSTTSLIVAGSTSTLYAELDSTQLGTKNLVAGQKKIVQATYILSVGISTLAFWQVGTCSSTDLASGVDEFFPVVPAGNSAQYVVQHELFKDYRIRCRTVSSAANLSAYDSVIPLT